MRKEKTLLIIGVWILVLPYLGFPNSWRKLLFVFTSFAVIYLSYLYYQQEKLRKPKGDDNTKTFVDNIENGE